MTRFLLLTPAIMVLLNCMYTSSLNAKTNLAPPHTSGIAESLRYQKGNVHFLFNNHAKFAHNEHEVRALIDDAEIVLVEEIAAFDPIYELVSVGELTPENALVLMQQYAEGMAMHLRFHEMRLSLLKMLHRSGKVVQGERPIERHSQVPHTPADCIIPLVNADTREALRIYKEVCETRAYRYYLRDKSLLTQLSETIAHQSGKNILVMRGASHTDAYIAFKEQYPSIPKWIVSF